MGNSGKAAKQQSSTWGDAPPRSAEAIAAWVREHVGVELAEGQLQYLAWAFLEGEVGRAGSPPPGQRTDSVVWACRGGGKTFVAAVATVMDLVFKRGIQVRLVAGSVEQGSRMYEHLRAILERPAFKGLVEGRITERRVRLKNGSVARLLAPTQASVRGVRVHKLRIDEVECLSPKLWEAAQLTTVSARLGEFDVRGAVETFSTMHEPGGMMARLVEECGEGKRELFKWGLVEVLGRCGEERKCNGSETAIQRGSETGTGRGAHLPQVQRDCVLLPECGGRAKSDGYRPGHVRIDDAIAMKGRVDAEVYDAEMLCKRPRTTDLVYRAFSVERHVVEEARSVGVLLCGMDFGIRSPTVVLWAQLDAAGVLRVIDERVVKDEVLDRHVDAILASRRGLPAWVGIDPAGANRNDQTGISSAEVMRRAGLRVKWRRGEVQEGLALVRARLAPADGSPARLLVHARCRELIKSLETYRYNPSNRTKMEPLKDGPDHAADALRYLVVCLDEEHQGRGGRYLP